MFHQAHALTQLISFLIIFSIFNDYFFVIITLFTHSTSFVVTGPLYWSIIRPHIQLISNNNNTPTLQLSEW